jgi:hypothetical protein
MAANQSNQTLFAIALEKNSLWYTTMFLIILIIIVATLGNALVLAATWMERSFHQPSKYFIACLAVADLLIGVLFCPFHLYNNVHEAGITSIDLCRYYIWLNVFAESASIDTLTLISVDRYLKISQPLRYNLLMTTSKSFILIIIIWLISIAYATLAMFSYERSRGIQITPNYGCTNQSSVFFTVSAISAFSLPTFITLTMYTRILILAHKRRKAARNGQLGQTNQIATRRTSFYQDLKNIRMMAIVMGAFIICWGPFFTFKILSIYNPQSIQFFVQSDVASVLVADILPLLNSVCNPIIYAYFDERYREAFKRLFKKMCP